MNEQLLEKLVDSAEPEEIRGRLLEIGWLQKRLYSGDYSFFTHNPILKVGITRKTVDDLLNSIGDRFSKQLEEMLEYYDIRILLLEGNWHKVSSGSIISGHGLQHYTWDLIWNYLRRWQDKGFSLELTHDSGHTVDRLNKLYALYQKPFSLSARSREFSEDRVLAFPSGTRGKVALKVLEHFGSLRKVAEATIAELRQVDGIGEQRAEFIRIHFNRGEWLTKK